MNQYWVSYIVAGRKVFFLMQAIVLAYLPKSNSCEGEVLGVDWKSIFADAGQNYQDFAPSGGKTNPAYFISRAKVSVKMASISMAKKPAYVKEIKKFFGQAALGQKLAMEGTDPYAVIQSLQ